MNLNVSDRKTVDPVTGKRGVTVPFVEFSQRYGYWMVKVQSVQARIKYALASALIWAAVTAALLTFTDTSTGIWGNLLTIAVFVTVMSVLNLLLALILLVLVSGTESRRTDR